MNYNLPYLLVDLPEDIAKLKGCGQFKRAQRVIDQRLAKDLPSALRERLEMEKEIMSLIPEQYPYSFDEAVGEMSRTFSDFKPSELEALWEQDAVEWYYIEGQPYFKDTFVANVIKTRIDYASRVKNPEDLAEKKNNFALLDKTIAEMKKKGQLAYRIRMRSELTIEPKAERVNETIKVHLPIPVEYAQVKDFRLISTTPAPKSIAPSDFPQRTVYFEEKLQPGQVFSVEYEFTNRMKYVEPKPELVAQSQPTFYTEEQPPHIVFSPYIRSLTKELIGDEKNPLLRARRIYDFITNKVMYSFVRPYFTITNIPEYALTSLKGDCGIQALAFITLCRCAGIPARWQAGLYTTPIYQGNHDWAQFYVAPYGWLYTDCSFGGAAWREKAFERWNFFFCNMEPFRMPSASEFQHEFHTGDSFLRQDPYDNQNGEVEYEDRALRWGEFKSTSEVVEIKEVK